MTGALAVSKWVNALLGLHDSNRFGTAKGTSKNLGAVLLQWSRVEQSVRAEVKSGIQPVQMC